MSVVPEGTKYASRALGRLDQRVAVQAAARQFVHDLLHVQHADDAVDFSLVHRQAGVLALAQLLDDPIPIVVEVDADDLVARHHDVFHRGIFQIQDADQHLLMAMRNHRAGLGDHGAQFLAAQGIRGLLRRDAEQPQHAVGQQIRRPDERIQQQQQRRVDVGRRQREPFGMQGAEGLRRDLAKNQQTKVSATTPNATR